MATAATFRASFPEFADPVKYATGQINFWLGIGAKLLDAALWDDMLDHGLELFTAHHMVMAKQNAAAVATGAIPGQATGLVTAKAVDKVSVAYDVSASIMENAGHFNLSSYGQQFIYLVRLMGAGGRQVIGDGAVGVIPMWSVQ